MSVIESGGRTGLIARVQNILMRPATEWDVIEGEPATIPGLFTGYACILAAIPLVANLIQHLLFVHLLIIPGLVASVIGYFIGLLGVFITGMIIDALAPSFGAQRNPVQAMKLAVYPYTAVWVAGILYVLPILGVLALLAGLYGLYILYLGLPKLMKSPADKTTAYFIVSVLVAIVVMAIINWVIFIIGLAMAATAIFGGAALGAAALAH
jgi:hypothetical protein